MREVVKTTQVSRLHAGTPSRRTRRLLATNKPSRLERQRGFLEKMPWRSRGRRDGNYSCRIALNPARCCILLFRFSFHPTANDYPIFPHKACQGLRGVPLGRRQQAARLRRVLRVQARGAQPHLSQVRIRQVRGPPGGTRRRGQAGLPRHGRVLHHEERLLPARGGPLVPTPPVRQAGRPRHLHRLRPQPRGEEQPHPQRRPARQLLLPPPPRASSGANSTPQSAWSTSSPR